jgi:hypothetical protein
MGSPLGVPGGLGGCLLLIIIMLPNQAIASTPSGRVPPGPAISNALKVRSLRHALCPALTIYVLLHAHWSDVPHATTQ